MFLDLWSLAILTGDLLELIVNHIESGTLSVSLPFLLSLIVFAVVCALSWRSTYIPDLPPVPRPPYVIQISNPSTSVYVNGERNSLADVRLLSSGADVDNVLRRFPHHQHSVNRIHLGGFSTGSTQVNLSGRQRSDSTPSAVSSSSQAPPPTRTSLRVVHHQQQPGQQRQGSNGGGSSLLLGYLRPTIRPFIGNRTGTGSHQAQSLIVYHRVNVYHHHLHHHHPQTPGNTNTSDTASPDSVPSPSTSQSISLEPQDISASLDENNSVGLSTVHIGNQQQSELGTDETNISNEHNHILENPVEIEVPPININMNEAGEEIIIQSTEETGPSSEGLRQRITVNAGQNTENSNTPRNIERITSDGSNVPDLVDNNKTSNATSETESASQHQDQTSRPVSDTSTSGDSANDIKFIIKFLNDTQKDVTSQARETIADFKRKNFATELSENKTVRLIFNGRVLDNDNSTLEESGIFDHCVVHCLIVARPTTGGNPTDGTTTGGLNQGNARRTGGLVRGTPEPGMFFVSFVGVFLIFLWFICFHFGQHFFTQSAVVSLTVLTAIFLIGLVAFYLPVHPNPN